MSKLMAYTEKNVVAEIILINIIRIAFVAVCVSFIFPLFNSTIMFFDVDMFSSSQTLTGFNMIFGIESSNVTGHPFALVMFMFPVIAIMVTMIDFLYNHLHIVILISGIVGIILSIVFFIAGLVNMNGKEKLFDVTLYEVQTGLSWGCLIILGIYVAIIGLSFLYKGVAE